MVFQQIHPKNIFWTFLKIVYYESTFFWFSVFSTSFFCVFSTKNVSFNKIRMLTRFFNCHFLDNIFIVKNVLSISVRPETGRNNWQFLLFSSTKHFKTSKFQLLFETLLRMNWKLIDFLKFLPKQFTGRQTFLFYRNISFWCVFVKHFLRFSTILFQKF